MLLQTYSKWKTNWMGWNTKEKKNGNEYKYKNINITIILYILMLINIYININQDDLYQFTMAKFSTDIYQHH